MRLGDFEDIDLPQRLTGFDDLARLCAKDGLRQGCAVGDQALGGVVRTLPLLTVHPHNFDIAQGVAGFNQVARPGT